VTPPPSPPLCSPDCETCLQRDASWRRLYDPQWVEPTVPWYHLPPVVWCLALAVVGLWWIGLIGFGDCPRYFCAP
jgi:hypothetical protein